MLKKWCKDMIKSEFHSTTMLFDADDALDYTHIRGDQVRQRSLE